LLKKLEFRFQIGFRDLYQVVAERFAEPGKVVIGPIPIRVPEVLSAPLNGVGSSDAAVAIALGKIWLRYRNNTVIVEGKLPVGCMAKILILHLIGNRCCRGGLIRPWNMVEIRSMIWRCGKNDHRPYGG